MTPSKAKGRRAARPTRANLLPLRRALLQQMLEAGGVATWLWDLASDTLHLSPAQDHLSDTGGTEPAIGRADRLDTIHHDDRARAHDWLDAAKCGQAVGELTYRALHQSGRMHYYQATVDVCLGHGKLTHLLGTIQDVTARSHAERRLLRKQSVLLQLARAVQPESVGADQALRQITEVARTTMGADAVGVWLLQPDSQRIRCMMECRRQGHYVPDFKPVRIERFPRYFDTLWQDRVMAVHDVHTDPRVSELLDVHLSPQGVRSLLDIAVVRAGQPIGMVCFDQHGATRHWGLDEQQFAISIADLLVTVFERVDREAAESALARSEALLHDLVNHAPSVVHIKDADGRYLLANRQFQQLTQLEIAAIIGRSDNELLPPALASALSQHDRHVSTARRPLEVVERLPVAGGQRTYLSIKFPLYDRSNTFYGTATISSDITDYENTLAQLRESESRFRQLAEAAFDAVLIHDGQRVIECNSNLLEMFGYSRSELLQTHPFHLTAPQHRELAARTAARGGGSRYESWGMRKDGSVFPMEVKGRGADLDGVPVRVVSLRDLTRQRAGEQALRAGEERYRAFIAATTEAIWRADIDPPMPIDLDVDEQADWLFEKMRIVECNLAMAQLYGFDRPDDAYGLSMAELYDPRFFRKIAGRFARLGYNLSETETPYRNRKGEFVWMNGSFFGTVENGHLQRVWCIQRDVTERRRHVAELEYQATHDPLTGLHNRKWLTAAVDACIAEQPAPLALLFIDLDHFKEINDTLGHHVGDLLLAQIGPRLKPLLRGVELARLGGDEFAVLVSEMPEQQAVINMTRAIVEEIRRPFEVAGLRLEIGASIGIALYPEHGHDTDTLMRCADVAMYLAKRDRLGWAVYQPELDEHSPRRLALMTDLGPAMRENQLFLVFQPKIDLKTGTLTGFEALLRWQHPVHGNIPPGQFIPLAEMGEIIRPLTLWVIEHALKQLSAWREMGLETRVAVNVSPRNLLDEDCPAQLQQLIERYRVPADALQLEITEGALIADPEKALEVTQRIHALGVRLAIDDFGTGYSSLSYLKRLPLDTLKIDLSFVRQMLESQADAMIVRSTVALAHNLGLRVIAEGVEDGATLATLREMGCDEAQGYHIDRPLAADAATERLLAEQPSVV
jgi:diguanylate cyclase (GGDEF)-like protein/PAS domain S-box-containing protein